MTESTLRQIAASFVKRKAKQQLSRSWSGPALLIVFSVLACGARTGLEPDDLGTEDASTGGRAGVPSTGGAGGAASGATNRAGSTSTAGRPAAGSSSIGGTTGLGGSTAQGGALTAGQGGEGGAAPAAPAPRLLAPLSTSTVTSHTPRLRWKLSGHSDSAQVELCRDRACTQSITTFVASGESTLVPQQLKPGLYYWRARGVQNGVLGRDVSSAWEFFVGVTSAAVNSAWGTTLDVNADGFADVLVGAYYANANHSGAAYLYLGGAKGLSTKALTLNGPHPGANFGSAVASAGDVNGDGFDDVVVGEVSLDSNAGAAYVYLGAMEGLGATSIVLGSPDGANARFGYRVASAGDVNGDGYADVLVSETFKAGRPGAYLFPGTSHGTNNSPTPVNVPASLVSPFTGAVASAGDVNGDGFGDVVIGMTDVGSGGGEAYIFMGSQTGLATAPVTLKSAVGPNLGFAPSVACAGDVNGDGYADVIVGSQTEAGTVGDGNAYLYWGSAKGIVTTPVVVPIPGGPNGGFGYMVSSAGDLNADGFADIVIGAPGAQADLGFADVYFGSKNGVSSPIIIPNPGGFYFGTALAPAGDLDNDGYADLLIGATGGAAQGGIASIYYGDPAGIRAASQQLINVEAGSQFASAVARLSGFPPRRAPRRRR